MTEPHIDSFRLGDDGSIPNNADLPLLIYRGALSGQTLSAAGCRALFAGHGWSAGGWVNGIFAYHHYHATAHEALGVIAGSAKVKMGGEDGVETTVAAGDVIVIPAGVAHKNLGASDDFSVVGAYPAGSDVDMNRGHPDERPAVLAAIVAVPRPAADPVFGAAGPLTERWR